LQASSNCWIKGQNYGDSNGYEDYRGKDYSGKDYTGKDYTGNEWESPTLQER